jgi:hypothetical protein
MLFTFFVIPAINYSIIHVNNWICCFLNFKRLQIITKFSNRRKKSTIKIKINYTYLDIFIFANGLVGIVSKSFSVILFSIVFIVINSY